MTAAKRETVRREIATVKANILRTLTSRAGSSMGVVEANVFLKEPDQFIVELPGYTNLEEARKVIGTSASIKFYWARTVNTELARFRTYDDEARQPENPADPAIDFTIRGSGKVIKWTDPEYRTMIESWGDPIVEGEELARADQHQTPTGYIPTITFSSEGGRKMEAWSRKVQNRREKLAAVLDGKVLSIAPLENNTILRDNAQITGQFDTQYVLSLKNLLNSGALPVDLK